MSGRDCVAKGGKKKMELRKKKEWERLSGSVRKEKDGAEEEVAWLMGVGVGGEKKKARRIFCCGREYATSEVL